MKTNYLLQNNRRNKKRFTPLIIVGIFLVIIFCTTLFVPLFFPSLAHGIGRPVWVGGNFFFSKTGTLGGFIVSRNSLMKKNKELQVAYNDLQNKYLATSIVEQENKELKKAWGRDREIIGILAVVLSKPPQSFYDTLVLDVGEDEGILVGQHVVVSDTVLLGVITEVFDDSSRGQLFSSVDRETLALIDRTGVPVTLIGKGAGNFEIRVPQDFDIIKGDIITLPGMGPRIVSTVFEIESNPTDSFKRVLLRIPISLSELRFVSVIK